VDNTALYEVMGVPKTATSDEIKKHFRKRAVREHPDKGGDPDKVRPYPAPINRSSGN
jgi:DnaJ family protein A protein 2